MQEVAGWRVVLAALVLAGTVRGQVALRVTPEQVAEQAEQLAAAGEPRQALMMYRLLLRADPENTAAYERMAQIAAATPVSDPEAELDNLARLFPDGTHLRKTAHFLIVYNTSNAFAESRARLLEEAYEAFFRKMRAAGLRPLPIAQRMVAIVFDRHEDYLAYAKKTQNIDVSDTAGYFSPLTNRIAMFNAQSSPQLRGMAEQIARLEGQITQLDGQIDAAARRGDTSISQRLRSARAQAVSALSQVRNNYQRQAGLNNIAQTFHETAHQLAYNSDIQWAGATYPFWYSEGLGTNFETVNPAAPFGPGEENYPRRYALRQAVRRGKLTPLAELATAVRIPSSADRSDWYGQSWGLFYWLYKQQPEGLRRYRALVNARGREASEQTLLADFEAAFGPVAQVEQAWQAFVYALR